MSENMDTGGLAVAEPVISFEGQETLCPPESLLSTTIVGLGHLGSQLAKVLAEIGVGTRVSRNGRSSPASVGSPTLSDMESVPSATTIATTYSEMSTIVNSATRLGTSRLIGYDHDVVDLGNIAASFYRPDQVGALKADALKQNVFDFTGTVMETHPLRFPTAPDHSQFHTDIVVFAVDSRDARVTLWRMVELSLASVKLLVDMRSGMDMINILAYDLSAGELNYPERLRDPTGLEIPCSARSVGYNSSTAAGLAASVIKAFSMGSVFPREIMVCHKTFGTLFLGTK